MTLVDAKRIAKVSGGRNTLKRISIHAWLVILIFSVNAAGGDEWTPFWDPYVEPSSPTTGESVTYFVP